MSDSAPLSPITVLGVMPLDKSQYMETSGKARVCCTADLRSPENIFIEAKTIIRENAVLHGDLGKINIGKLSVIGSSVVLQPPTAPSNSKLPFLHMNIGDYVMIGEGSVIRACDIRSCIRIGSNCVVGERCMLRDCCVVLDGTELSPDTIVPPFTVFGGVPGRMVGELCETAPATLVAQAEDAFRVATSGT